MRFLVDECIGRRVVLHLHNLGHDVAFMRDLDKGAPDPEVLAWAVAQKRILITADKDFGERVFLDRLEHTGIILVRAADTHLAVRLSILDRLLSEHTEAVLGSSFIVATERNTRIRSRY